MNPLKWTVREDSIYPLFNISGEVFIIDLMVEIL